jgi:SAM-dependent methyltransferase
VIAIDYSSAVDACFANLGHLQIDVLQADIFALPFHGAAFSFVYSLGVLQHTPDPKAAFMSLVRHLAPAGRICVDLYERKFPSTALPKYWLRPITKRMPKGALFKSIEVLLPALLVPVADYSGLYPLTARQRKEWALLDTFDWLSPTFDYPQSAAELALWFTEAGLVQREVVTSGHLVGRGRKSDANWN